MTPHHLTPARLLSAALLIAALHGVFPAPALAQANPGGSTPAAQPVLNAGPGCEADVRRAYNDGFLHGVDAIKAQLAQATARMQDQVQAQLNEQLKQLQQQSSAELDTRIAAAQERALNEQAAAGAAPPAVPNDARMPSLSGTMQALDGRMARNAIQPAARPAPLADDADSSTLPPGTTITITDPQNLPPDLYRALMDYAAR